MLITTEFAIERYSGQNPLTLLTPPSSMDAATQQQYNLFMANIVTIYGSQNEFGIVPVFYKTALGAPSPSSTLTQLDPGQEYYFISKNTAVFPYAIPAIGGSITTSCPKLDVCCPSVNFTSSTVTLSGPPENIYAYLTANMSGLEPGAQYNYVFEPVAANWPSKISPLSGTVIPMSYSDSVDAVFRFCPYSGGGSDYLPFILDLNHNKEYSQKNIFSSIKIKLYPLAGSSCDVMSDVVTVKCNKCLPNGSTYRPKVTISGSPLIGLSSSCCANPIPVIVNISGAEISKQYTYNIESWPETVSLNPSSGTTSFGDGNGRISSMVSMSGIPSAVIKFILNDSDSGEKFIDFTTIRCTPSC